VAVQARPHCSACLLHPPAFDACVTLADYGFPWDRLVARLKFEQQPELARSLAHLLAQAVRQAAPAAVRLVLPVPLSTARLAERGYNQSWELARHLAARLCLPASAGLLQRWRDSPHQVGASRSQRLANLRDALWVDPLAAAALHGRDVALVDDVLTTGATAQAAALALRAAGARSVQVWVLARTASTEPP